MGFIAPLCRYLDGALYKFSITSQVVYPSFRWVDECLANSESPERLKLLSTVADVNS